jgi:hypothetical protein
MSYLGEQDLHGRVRDGLRAAGRYKNVNANGSLCDEETVDYTAMAADMMFGADDGRNGDGHAQHLKTDFEDAFKTNFNAGRPPVEHHRPQRVKGGELREARTLPKKIRGGMKALRYED